MVKRGGKNIIIIITIITIIIIYNR